jgi:hypothetical protein
MRLSKIGYANVHIPAITMKAIYDLTVDPKKSSTN